MLISSSARRNAILQARQALEARPVYLDTETTGTTPKDEIIEISIVDEDCKVLLNKFVRPLQPIPPEATRIHGITNDDVKSALRWPILWQEIRPLITGRLIVIYNAEFDLRMMQQSMAIYKQPWNARFDTFDLMKYYADFRSVWDLKRQAYRYFSLAEAGKFAQIPLPNAHRATADSLLSRALIHHIAEAQI